MSIAQATSGTITATPPRPGIGVTRQCVCGGWTRFVVCQYCGTTDPSAVAEGLLSTTPLVQRAPEDLDRTSDAWGELAALQGSAVPAPAPPPVQVAQVHVEPVQVAPVQVEPVQVAPQEVAYAGGLEHEAPYGPVGAAFAPAYPVQHHDLAAPHPPVQVEPEAPGPDAFQPDAFQPDQVQPLLAPATEPGWAAALPPSGDGSDGVPALPSAVPVGVDPSGAAAVRVVSRSRPRWLMPVAAAAALTLGVGALLLLTQGGDDGGAPASTVAPRRAAGAPAPRPAPVVPGAAPAVDAQAKALVLTVSALEQSWAADHGGAYTSSLTDLATLGATTSPSVRTLTVTGSKTAYAIEAAAATGRSFCFASDKGGGVRPC